MSNLGEDVEAFFRSGDEGTYAGGPASSVAPFALEEEPAEQLIVGVTPEQLARRARLKRLVATIVGGLGAGLLLIFVWLLGTTAHAQQSGASMPSPVRSPPPALATVTRAAPSTASPAPQAATPASSEVATPEEPAAAPNPHRAVAPARERVEARAARKAMVPRVKPVALPTGSASLPRVSRGASHSPPTASFPD